MIGSVKREGALVGIGRFGIGRMRGARLTGSGPFAVDSPKVSSEES